MRGDRVGCDARGRPRRATPPTAAASRVCSASSRCLRVGPQRVGVVGAVVQRRGDQHARCRCGGRATTSSETKLSAWPGHAKSAGGRFGQALELADRLPADEADESAGERRVPGDVRGAASARRGARGRRAGAVGAVGAERALGATCRSRARRRPPSPSWVSTPKRRRRRRRSSATRCRPAPRTPAGRCPACRARACGRCRSGVSPSAKSSRSTGTTRWPAASGASKSARVGRRHRRPSVGCADRPDSSGSTSKQVRAPVWQAGPTCSTCTSRVSPSQSRRRAAHVLDVAADVSPLRQYSWRDCATRRSRGPR